jgi:peptidoglycan/LPS O-acetylase OafA/YrhL
MSAYDRWFNEVAYGRLGLGTAGLFVVAAYLFALAVGLWVTVRRLRPGAPPATVTVGFALVTIVYVGVVGNLAEVGENYRFRFVVEPLAVALVAFGVNRLLERRSASLSASPPSERPAGGGSGR